MSDLTTQRPSVGIRFRILGELWKPNFMHIVKMTDRGAIFNDQSTKEFVFVMDLAEVVQFEVDDRYNDLQPNFHYEVNPR